MIINGNVLAAKIIAELKNQNKSFADKKVYGILVGRSRASLSFLRQKKRAAEQLGLSFVIKKFSRSWLRHYVALTTSFLVAALGFWGGLSMAIWAGFLGGAVSISAMLYALKSKIITEDRLKAKISALVAKKSVIGMIVQLPIPKYDSEETKSVLDAVSYEKDADCLGERRSREFYADPKGAQIAPPAVGTVATILRELGVKDVAGKKVVVYGQGRLVGKPIAAWLGSRGAEISILRKASSPEDRATALKNADIIVTGVGKPDEVRITGGMIKPGAIVIDFGSPADCDAKSIDAVGGIVTPTPGGTGPILVAELFRNLLKLYP